MAGINIKRPEAGVINLLKAKYKGAQDYEEREIAGVGCYRF